MRLRRRPWIAKAIQEYGDLIVNLEEEVIQPDWSRIFGRQAPLYVELGTGKGAFITEMARCHGDCNFVGIETQHDIIFYAARLAREKGLQNVKFLLIDAGRITELFAPHSLAGLYINFCDPWPKKRHAKRRLTFHGFYDNYRRVLEPDGWLYFKTDNRNLFEFSLNEFVNNHVQLRNISLDLHQGTAFENVMTEYETKFKALGQPIYRLEAQLG